MNILILGGTGPTGPYIVNGLLARNHNVTIMHGGFHEVEFAGPVEDLHGDVHFRETLHATLGDRKFDVVICMYGRLKDIAEFMVGRTDRFIGIGSASGGAGPHDPRWGKMGRPFATSEATTIPSNPDSGRSGLRGGGIDAARERIIDLHRQGAYSATYIGYRNMYGPRQMAPEEWSVIRRILDGRRQLVIADGGLKIQQRAYVENAAEAVLLAVDKAKEAAGEVFNVGEQPLYTIRQRIEVIAATMGVELELVDMPFPLARPSHYLWFNSPQHVVKDDSKIRRVLGYTEKVPVDEAHVRTVHWLLDNREAFQAEWEEQTDDAFDYEGEDELIRRWKKAYADVAAVEIKTKVEAHRYRHPAAPGEAWRRPERAAPRTLEYY